MICHYKSSNKNVIVILYNNKVFFLNNVEIYTYAFILQFFLVMQYVVFYIVYPDTMSIQISGYIFTDKEN